jgi:hypothetical protein
MKHTTRCTLWVLLFTSASAHAQTSLTLLTPPLLRVNPVTGSGATTLRLQNAADAPVDVTITAVPSDNFPNQSRLSFVSEGEGDMAAALRTTLDARSIARIPVVVEGIRGDGDYAIDFFANAVKLGTLTARRAPPGLAVEQPAAGEPLSLIAAAPHERVLTNADPFDYRITWKWTAEGRDLCDGTTIVPAHARMLLVCTPLVGQTVRELFRRPVTPTVLTLHADTNPPSGQSPILLRQELPASVSYFQPAIGQTVTYVILVLVLVAGGLASLFLNTALPNFLQKLSLREQLLAIGVSIGNLSNNIDSRIRVLLRLERSRLIDLLRSRWSLSPEFAGVVARSTAGMAQLRARVDVLHQLDLVCEGIGQARLNDVPPTLLEQIELLHRRANALLAKNEPNDDDLRAARDAVRNASDLVDALDEPGEEFGIKLVARVKAVRDAERAIDDLPTWKSVKASVAWPWAMVAHVDEAAATVPAAQYAQLDNAVRRVELMQEYAQLSVGWLRRDNPEIDKLPPDERERKIARLALRDAHEARMLTCLSNPSYAALVSARRRLREIGDDVYSDDLRRSLNADPKEAGIDWEPDIAYERAPLTFRVEFYDRFTNEAAARSDWTCEWDFDDGLVGKGWTVSHYFVLSRARKSQTAFRVTAQVRDDDGKLVMKDDKPVVLSREIKVMPSDTAKFESRVWAEAAKLAAALLIAIFGLVAGAHEQLVKLDVVPGLVAVFLVGFGADTIKNLLTAKS